MTNSIFRLALFASAGIMSMSVPAFAQLGPIGNGPDGGFGGSEKPRSYSYDTCTMASDYKLEFAGSPSPWRKNNAGSYEYFEGSPVVTCGTASRSTLLKCVNASSGEVLSGYECNDYRVIGNFNTAHANYDVRGAGIKQNPWVWSALEKTDLGACGYDAFTWRDITQDYAVCGTTMVDRVAQCVNKETQAYVDDSFCSPVGKPTGQVEVTSTQGCYYDYSVGAATVPPASCGVAQKTRAVACQRGDGLPAGEGDCVSYLTNRSYYNEVAYGPEKEGAEASNPMVGVYGMPSACAGLSGKALYDECDLVSANEGGQQYLRPRSVVSFDDARSCVADQPSDYEWKTGAYSPDRTGVCGTNTRSASVSCFSKTTSLLVDDSLCDPAAKPQTTQTFDDVSGCVPQTSAATCGDAPNAGDRSQFQSCLSSVGIGGADKPWNVELMRAVTLTDGAKVYCVRSEGPAFGGSTQPDHQLCSPSDWNGGDGVSNDSRPTSYIALEGTGVCASTSLESCTPAPAPAPAPAPTPTAPKEFRLGTCNYTSGSSKYACGGRANYRPGPAAPYPHDICSGTILSGSERSDEVGTPPNSTDGVGPNWVKPPAPLINVPGAQCVVHFRASGYSNSVNESWQTVYFSGPPTGVADGLFIGPKP